MPLNDRKVLSIILEECNKVEDRCRGYRKELIEAIAEIINHERQHRVQKTNIQVKVSGTCNVAAQYLASKRETADETAGGQQ